MRGVCALNDWIAGEQEITVATAEINRMMLWTDLEGTVIADRWRIVRLVRPEGRVAWFEAATSEGQPLMLSITETLNDDDELLARLRAAAEIRHPNLVRIFDSAATSIDDSPVVVGALERTEENLEDVLRDRPLNASEARAVLDALVQGIAAIHARGLVHGRMEPSSVLALGDTIKLRTDCLQIPESGFSAAAAANVQAVGRIITRAITRRDPLDENDPVLQLLPEPLARAVRRALSGHARIEELAAVAGIRIIPATNPDPDVQRPAPLALVPAASPKNSDAAIAPSRPGAEPSATAEVPNPVEEEPEQATHSGPQNAASLASAEKISPEIGTHMAPPAPTPTAQKSAEMLAESRQPSLFPAAEPARDLSHLLQDDGEDLPLWRRPSAPWVLGGAAGILLVTVLTLIALLHHSPAPAASAPPVVVTQPMHPSAPKSSPAATVHSQPAAAAPQTETPQPGWRVIAWTYDREADAQHKVDALAQKYPQLRPAVFSPKRRAPYLVTLGGVMTKDQAFALRKEAMRLGLPRDTYAQNYH